LDFVANKDYIYIYIYVCMYVYRPVGQLFTVCTPYAYMFYWSNGFVSFQRPSAHRLLCVVILCLMLLCVSHSTLMLSDYFVVQVYLTYAFEHNTMSFSSQHDSKLLLQTYERDRIWAPACLVQSGVSGTVCQIHGTPYEWPMEPNHIGMHQMELVKSYNNKILI